MTMPNTSAEVTAELEKLRQEKRLADEFFQNMIVDNVDGILILGQDQAVRFCNPAAEEILGRSAKELIGSIFGYPVINQDKTELDIFHPEKDKCVVEMRLKQTQWKGENVQLAMLRDISERVNSEQARQESEEMYRAVFENALEGILLVNIKNKKINYANNAFCNMLDYRLEDLQNMPFLQLHPKAMQQRIINLFEAQARGEISLAPNIPCLRKDGQVIYADINTGKVNIKDTEYNIGFFTDVTERKKSEDELIKSRALSEAADKAKSNFLANMSHEIRTPLNGIIGSMQYLQSTDLDEEQQEFVNICLKSSDRLSKLLINLLDLSKVEHGKLQIRQDEFNLREVIDSISYMFKYEIDKKNLDYQCNFNADTPEVLIGDKTRLTQILFNLVGNAVKYTSTGEVKVEVSGNYEQDPDHYRLLLTISDTGTGIADEFQEHIFETFTQAEEDSSFARQYDGAGLGLPLVKHLAALMKGNVFLESQVDQGTTVYVQIPFEVPSKYKET